MRLIDYGFFVKEGILNHLNRNQRRKHLPNTIGVAHSNTGPDVSNYFNFTGNQVRSRVSTALGLAPMKTYFSSFVVYKW